MKKFCLFLFSCLLFFVPLLSSAQPDEASGKGDQLFRARVMEILDQKSSVRDDGSTAIQQKLKLTGLEGEWKGKEVIFDGTKVDVLSAPVYKVGDRVVVNYSRDSEGNEVFYVVDFVREGSLYWLAFIFAIVVILIGRLKGLRALVVLLLTFFVILKFIVPRILAGSNPLVVSIIGSLFILVLAIYLTEGFKRDSTIAVVSIFLSLVITGILSIWFTSMAKLTGFAGDEAIYLNSLAGGNINLKGLLLAGIILGALGVLDDIVVSQVTLVKELKTANPKLPKSELYRKSMKVGISHLSSMVNTLFLAYVGASLPLLILFSVRQPPFLTFGQIINNEMIATEIVRTLTGSIGLVLAVPIATLLSVYFVGLGRQEQGRKINRVSGGEEKVF